ncbi:TIGR04222 domain-containing protein [Streptosporangium canum]|uniref:TIGR04222 domain-containing protein n=1 Tax=Streptosporangium canum TaxID=324952 RepID=A0A1I3YXS1_9ACTN|nr:TIGR04222 domain-containing membrane protein [Streptosporangium canum]SFK36011.1 TIGR04222 domain-containing protein [Streptosporangium canum]
MEFVLFVTALVLALVVNLTAAALRGEHRRVRSAAAGHHGSQPTPYELAYLSGGPLRVVNTALGVLARGGAIRVSRGGQVSLVLGARPSPEPIEQAVLDALRARGNSCSVGELRRTTADGQAMSGLRYRLVGMGLLVPDGALTGAARLLSRLLLLTLLSVVFVIGAFLAVPARGFYGAAAVLIGFLAVAGGLVTYLRQRRALRGLLSKAGHDVLASARRVHVRGARPTTPDLAFAVAVPVALYGLGELGDPGLEEELKRSSTQNAGCAGGSCGGGSSGSDASYGGGGDFGSGGWGGGDSGGGDSGGGSSCGGGGCGGGCGGGG